MNYIGITKESIKSDYSDLTQGQSLVDIQVIIGGNMQEAHEFLLSVDRLVGYYNKINESENNTKTLLKHLSEVVDSLYENADKIEYIDQTGVEIRIGLTPKWED